MGKGGGKPFLNKAGVYIVALVSRATAANHQVQIRLIIGALSVSRNDIAIRDVSGAERPAWTYPLQAAG
ncbi:hypothetical protein [Sphingomonas aerophila]|uniref:hypothetical protein n=1 Tax=Sphingomonas aerophila TaxID=1344948 RepID=UPI001C845A61|nr:hypothetical protein [Sphingomonas aerophila]